MATSLRVVYHSSMPEVSVAEIYFIVIMMALVVVISVVSLYIFIKTYKKEMREKQSRESAEKKSENVGEEKTDG